MNYGPLWVDIQGTQLLAEEITIIQHRQTGGVLLFTNNFTDVTQLKALIQDIRDKAGKPILISVDHEGGRIWRFKEGFHKPAASQNFGTLYKTDPELAVEYLESAGRIVAHELLNCDVDLSFAPVLDVDNGVSTVIGDRSYSDDPWVVTDCAHAFIRGLNSQGMAAVGKHFPGHGGCTMDSHFISAVDTRSFEEIEAKDLIPFTKLSKVLAGVMPAHVVYSAIDSKPAGFSEFWLQKILRDQIGFKGAIVSDCLSMTGSGYATNILEGIEKALHAGCDMVIASKQSRENLLQILNTLNWEVSNVQMARIESLAGDFANPNLRVKLEIVSEMIKYA